MPATIKAPNKLMPEKSVEHANVLPAADYWKSYSNYVGMTAHDLLAPLRKLGVLTDRLTGKYKPAPHEEVDEYIRRIHACIAEMKTLVEGFTELAAVAPESLENGSLDLDRLVKKWVRENATMIKEKQAEINIHSLPVIEGDAGQFELVVKKILENALRFSQPGVAPRVELRSERLTIEEKRSFNLPAEKEFHRVVIGDNGIGFAPGDAEKIFQPLVRLHGRSQYTGNGLGLALVKRVLDNHGGLVYAESEQGKGTCIFLIVPETQH